MEEQEEKEPSIVLEDGAGNPGATNGGKNGTGGLLIINTAEFENNGKIESNGSNGGDAVSYGGSGGASGGGSINIFCKELLRRGEITAIGGTGGNYSAVNCGYGGNGGNGSVSIGAIVNNQYKEF